ncbi:hypothetical protein F0562_004133 [Nyssa sinensis]|uniref:Uncharacterized protein n=1 Tax=Nyssa sinensis TaxID=561372 RepID=A0A5J5BYH6_9ASTE|nr:hypothetical protein F0562_004133 [Nyssa sinensis]
MGQFSGSDNTSSKSENGTRDATLDSRKKATIHRHPQFITLLRRKIRNVIPRACHGFRPACFAAEQINERFLPEQSGAGVLGAYCYQGTQVNKLISSNRIALSEVNVDATASPLLQCSIPSTHPVNIKVEHIDNSLMSLSGNYVKGSSGADAQVIKLNTEIPDDFEDDLDHIVLKERRRMLLSRKSLELTKPLLEGNSSWLSNPVVEDMIQSIAGIGKGEGHSVDGESSGGPSSAAPQCSALTGSCRHIESTKSGNSVGLQESDGICSSKIASTAYESCGGQEFVSGGHKSNFPYTKIVSVKSELETPDESYGDEVDHMLLQDRIKLLASRAVPNFDISRNFKCLGKIVPSARDCSPIVSDSAKPLRINRPKKRRKTATDSVETALEEDAPGLLQVLVDKGVTVNEIKLYGEMESNEPLDDSFSEDGFAELEAVISKLFSRRHSLLKLAPIRCTKGEKASYLLGLSNITCGAGTLSTVSEVAC